MTISNRAWQAYINALRKVSVTASEKFATYITTHPPVDQQAVNALIDYAYGLSTKYGEAAAELAAQMYDTVALSSGVMLEPAIPAATATIDETARAVVGTLKTGNNDIVADAVGRMVKMAGVDTTMQNAVRDGAEWAWIPRGDTCAFCIALASNGWQEASRRVMKGNHAEHIHANCDCTFAVRFNGRGDVEGYDPERYKMMYKYELDDNGNPRVDEHGEYIPRRGSSKSKINGMRRDFYSAAEARAERQGLSDDALRLVLNESSAEEVVV